MNWEQRFCPNQSCTVDFWMVRHAADDHDLWHLLEHFDGGAFTVAAVDPV
jgi:hypothetical protein